MQPNPIHNANAIPPHVEAHEAPPQPTHYNVGKKENLLQFIEKEVCKHSNYNLLPDNLQVKAHTERDELGQLKYETHGKPPLFAFKRHFEVILPSNPPKTLVFTKTVYTSIEVPEDKLMIPNALRSAKMAACAHSRVLKATLEKKDTIDGPIKDLLRTRGFIDLKYNAVQGQSIDLKNIDIRLIASIEISDSAPKTKATQTLAFTALFPNKSEKELDAIWDRFYDLDWLKDVQGVNAEKVEDFKRLLSAEQPDRSKRPAILNRIHDQEENEESRGIYDALVDEREKLHAFIQGLEEANRPKDAAVLAKARERLALLLPDE